MPAAKQVAQQEFWMRLEQALRERDMLASDLAVKLKTSRATVSEWKVRGSWPTGYVLIQLGKALRVNLHWLLTGEGTMDVPGRDERPTDDALLRRGFNLALANVEMALDQIRARTQPSRPGTTAPLMPPDEALALAAVARPATPPLPVAPARSPRRA